MSIVTLDEFKTYKKITKTTDDDKLGIIVDAANQLAKTYCRRTFVDYYSSEKTEYLDGTEDSLLFLSEFPINAITSVEVSSDGVTYTELTANEDYFVDYTLDAIRTPSNLAFSSGALPAFNSVKVVYTGGYENAPDDLKIAVMDLVEYYRQEEYTPRKAFQDNSIENLGFREGGGSNLPAHVKRVFEMYKAN